MPETPKIGAGTSLSYSTDNGGTYTPLAKIIGFTPAKLSVAKVPIDSFDNPTFNGLPVEDQIPGWITPGTYGVKLHYLKTQFGVIRGLVGVQGSSGTTTKFKIIKSDGSGYVFAGYIAELGEEIPMKEAMSCDAMLQITGGVAVFSSTQA